MHAWTKSSSSINQRWAPLVKLIPPNSTPPDKKVKVVGPTSWINVHSLDHENENLHYILIILLFCQPRCLGSMHIKKWSIRGQLTPSKKSYIRAIETSLLDSTSNYPLSPLLSSFRTSPSPKRSIIELVSYLSSSFVKCRHEMGGLTSYF